MESRDARLSGSAARPRVLHLVPAYADRMYAAGHWKACKAMGLALRDAGLDVHTHVFGRIDGSDVPRARDGAFSDIVIEYSTAPELVTAMRRRMPDARIHVRAHNAEAWQYVHRVGVMRVVTRPRQTYAVARLLARDARCRRDSANILSISEWDAWHYWARLPGAATIVDVPYFSPWPTLRPFVVPSSWTGRQSAVFGLPGTPDRIARAGTAAYEACARALAPLLPDWRFRVSTGVAHDIRSSPSRFLDVVDDLREPWDLLCTVKAIAVLTPLGFGAKTTVFDALAAGCRVLIHRALAKRLPRVARDSCIIVDPHGSTDWRAVARRLTQPPLADGSHAELRELARRAISGCIGAASADNATMRHPVVAMLPEVT